MNITKRNKIIIGAVALAGAAAVTGSAFTATGLSDNSGDDFIGGTITIAVDGAVLEDVDYNIGTNNEIDNVDVTLSGNVENRVLEIQFRDGSGPIGVAYSCTVINSSLFSTCTPTGAKTLSTAVTAVLFRVDN
jgi:hypothetical protein